MAAPFFDNIGGSVTGAAGTTAFTPTGAAAMCLAWSTVPANQIIYYRAEEAATWENGLGLWNGTTLTRNLIASSSGALISFGSAVLIYAVGDASQVQPHTGGGRFILSVANTGTTLTNNTGIAAATLTGTATAAIFATTNLLTTTNRTILTSATTANAQAGVSHGAFNPTTSTTAFIGGFEYVSRFGVTALPTGPRLVAGLSAGTFAALATDPSTVANVAAFTLDAADTNIQFTTTNATTPTKTNTGIPLVVNGWYEFAVWCAPGDGNNIYGRLIRLDTGAVWIGKNTTTTPVAGTQLNPTSGVTLSATTGTAAVVNFSSIYCRAGA